MNLSLLNETCGHPICIETAGLNYCSCFAGAITSWNVPILLSAWKLAPALAAGNAFVHKPSEQTPVNALRLADLIYEETDIPAGIYNFVPGYGEEAGAALTSHDGVDKVAFTGSTSVGREVAASAGRNLSAVSVELSGKNPNVIFPSANLEKPSTA